MCYDYDEDCPLLMTQDGIKSPTTGCYCGVHLNEKGKPIFKCENKESCPAWKILRKMDPCGCIRIGNIEEFEEEFDEDDE